MCNAMGLLIEEEIAVSILQKYKMTNNLLSIKLEEYLCAFCSYLLMQRYFDVIFCASLKSKPLIKVA